MKNYGKEIILDLHECSITNFNRKGLRKYFKQLCNLIDMKRCKLCFWDYKGYEAEYLNAPAHLQGTSAIQFISTSNITVHTLDTLKRIYINIFSCKSFDPAIVVDFTVSYFNCKRIKQSKIIDRI